MKKYFLLIILLILSGSTVFLFTRPTQNEQEELISQPEVTIRPERNEINDSEPVAITNPASSHCIENGGILEIITESDGSQFALCQFDDYACEEWTYFNNGCDIEADALIIEQKLIEKGLDLDGMQVVIKKHLGDAIEAAVVPVSVPVGGGYVFAQKIDNQIDIVADGNGAILCSQLSDAPDFSSYLIPICFDEETGLEVTR